VVTGHKAWHMMKISWSLKRKPNSRLTIEVKKEKNEGMKPVPLKPNLPLSMTSMSPYQSSDPPWHTINETIDSPPWHFLPNLLRKCNNIVSVVGASPSCLTSLAKPPLKERPHILYRIHVGRPRGARYPDNFLQNPISPWIMSIMYARIVFHHFDIIVSST